MSPWLGQQRQIVGNIATVELVDDCYYLVGILRHVEYQLNY